ncbi:MAG: DUF192 domain-containing protein [Ahrensia sp.]
MIRTVLVALFFCLWGAQSALAQEPMRLPVDAVAAKIMRDGETLSTFDIEIARTVEQRSNGLMHRRDLPRDRGMLFVFEDDSIRYFWMENTPTPLDIIYADSMGLIVHIAANTTPFSRAPISSLEPARYALEIQAGLSASLNIRVGDTIVHPVIGAQ